MGGNQLNGLIAASPPITVPPHHFKLWAPAVKTPPTGLEPVTWRLTAARSTIELRGIVEGER